MIHMGEVGARPQGDTRKFLRGLEMLLDAIAIPCRLCV